MPGKKTTDTPESTTAIADDIFDKGSEIAIEDKRTHDEPPSVADTAALVEEMEAKGERPADIQAAVEEHEYQRERVIYDEGRARFHARLDKAVADMQADAASDENGDENGEEGGYFIDLSQADEALRPMVAGTLGVAVCSAAEPKISTTGNVMIALRVKMERITFAHGASPEEQLTYRNRSVRDNLMFIGPNPVTGSRGTLWRVKQAFEAFGVPWPAMRFRSARELLEAITPLAEKLIGAVAQVEIGVEEAKRDNIDPKTGQPYPAKNTIIKYNKYISAPPATIGDEDLPF